MVLITQNFPEGQQSSLPFSLTPSQPALESEFAVATLCTKAACGQSKHLMASQEKGSHSQRLGKLLANTAFSTATSSTVNMPHGQTQRHQPGTKSLRWAQNSQLNLASVENPKKILRKH